MPQALGRGDFALLVGRQGYMCAGRVLPPRARNFVGGIANAALTLILIIL